MSSGVALALIFLGGAAYFFKRQSDKAKRDALLGETKGQDKILKENQSQVKNEIAEIDKRIDDFYKERKELQEAKSREDRAKGWNK